MAATATVNWEDHEGTGVLRLTGHLSVDTSAAVWREVDQRLASWEGRPLRVDVQGLSYLDGSGLAWLFHLRRWAKGRGWDLPIDGLREDQAALLHALAEAPAPRPPEGADERGFLESLGRGGEGAWHTLRTFTAFVGEVACELVAVIGHPARVRWGDALRVMDQNGSEALPIVALVATLIGLIMAFQAAIPMREFGADLYVPHLVALSLLKELGPIMTAIVLSGRTASNFAAEIGTMKVNEEIHALATMGIAPVRFLVLPRAIATLVMVPFLTVFADLCGLVGGAIVFTSMGYPVVTYIAQVQSAVGLRHLFSGLAKSLVFALVIAAIGCYSGLQTRSGASAVGDSATRAVVGGIFLVLVTDALFAVVYYAWGI